MAKREQPVFDPRSILAALERNYVDYVVIGGLARVLRGTDEVTTGVDICPSFAGENLARLGRAVAELDGRGRDGESIELDDQVLAAKPVVVASSAGELKIVGAPAGAPGGFVDLRRAATREHLGQGLQPLVASAADLARLAAALHREQDLIRLPQLRRIIELEADREQILSPLPATIRQPARRRAQRAPRASH